MRTLILGLAFVLLSCQLFANDQELQGWQDDRATYLQMQIKAIRRLGAVEQKWLREEADAVFAGVCRSSDPTMALSCSLESAAKICQTRTRKKACLLMLDALVVERLNATRFISARERFEIMNRSDNYKERMQVALNERYGSIAAAFSLNKAAACMGDDLACFARGIDNYCQGEARQGHLSYQSCASLLSLFLGTY